jgi:hypothetical protein
VYDWSTKRYFHKPAFVKATHDFFTSLQQLEKSNKLVQIFALTMSGMNEDLWKYFYMARKLFEFELKQDTLDIAKYKQKLRVLYPDRPVYFK